MTYSLGSNLRCLGAILAMTPVAVAQLTSAVVVNRPIGPSVYDPVRSRLISYDSGTVREWDGSAWTAVAAPSTPAVHLIFHAGFGQPMKLGSNLQTAHLWNGSAWTAVPLGAGPTGSGLVAYDTVRNQIVFFGGSSGDETWTWDTQTNWLQRTPASPPAPRIFGAMAFDVAAGRTVLFGGSRLVAPFVLDDQTYGFDGQQWTVLGTGGPARREHNMTYDAALGRVVIGGGRAEGDLQSWSGSAWVAHGQPRPVSTLRQQLAFDSANNRLLLHGGELSFVNGVQGPMPVAEMWSFQGLSFQLLATACAYPPRPFEGLVHDPVRQRVVMMGGTDFGISLNDLWEWNGISWSQWQGTTVPKYKIAYDEARQQLVQFGRNQFFSPDCRLRTGTGWSMVSGTLPPARDDHAMAYDRARQLVVVFGGAQVGGGQPLGDVWEWNGVMWSPRTFAVAPLPRVRAGLAFDGVSNRLVLHGGDGFGDTWAYDGASWVQLATGGPTGACTMTFDALRQRLVLNSGGDAYDRIGNVWVLRAAGVFEVGTSIAYDPARGGVMSWSGSTWFWDVSLLAPSSPAAATPFGSGCGTTPPVLGVTALPWLGQVMVVRASQVPAGQAAVLAGGASAITPIPLDSLGMFGCSLFVSVDTSAAVVATGTVADWSLPVPNSVSLSGAEIVLQAAAVAPGVNPANLVATNALRIRVGGL